MHGCMHKQIVSSKTNGIVYDNTESDGQINIDRETYIHRQTDRRTDGRTDKRIYGYLDNILHYTFNISS